jgi:hypothetical protein
MLGAALMSGAVSACAEGSDDIGAAAQATTPAYCIVNAHTDSGTIHFQGPNWLISSSEGVGPQELDIRVRAYVQPAISSTANFELDPSSVSTAVGYNLAERYEILGGARVNVANLAFQRLEAYPAFQRTIWEVRDADCNAVLGFGATYRPIGVFFRVVDTSDLTIPDVGVYWVGPLAVDPGGVAPVGPGSGAVQGVPSTGSGGGGDAGAEDAGDAGAADGG